MSDYPIAPLMVITVCHTELHTPLDSALQTARSIIHYTTHCTAHSTLPQSLTVLPAQFDGKQIHQEGIILQFSKIVTHVIRVFECHSLIVLQLCNIFLTLRKIWRFVCTI